MRRDSARSWRSRFRCVQSWLMTGNLGVFIAADLASFYLFFTLVSLAAYGLVVYDDSSPAKRAAAVYMALAILGEAFLLIGFVLLAAAAPHGSLLIRDAVAAPPTSPRHTRGLPIGRDHGANRSVRFRTAKRMFEAGQCPASNVSGAGPTPARRHCCVKMPLAALTWMTHLDD